MFVPKENGSEFNIQEDSVRKISEYYSVSHLLYYPGIHPVQLQVEYFWTGMIDRQTFCWL